MKVKLDVNAFLDFVTLATIEYHIECLSFKTDGNNIVAKLKDKSGVYSSITIPSFFDTVVDDYEFTLLEPKQYLKPYLNVFKNIDTVDVDLSETKMIILGEGYKSEINLHSRTVADEYVMTVDELPGEVVYTATESVDDILTLIKEFMSLNMPIVFNFKDGKFFISCEEKNLHTNVLMKKVEDVDYPHADGDSFEFSRNIFKFLKIVDGTFDIKVRRISQSGQKGCILSFDKDGISIGMASIFAI